MELFVSILFRLFDAVTGLIFVLSFTRAERSKGVRLIMLFVLGVLLIISYPPAESISDMVYDAPGYIVMAVQWVVYLTVSFCYGTTSVMRRIAAPVIFLVVSYLVNSGYIHLLFGQLLNHPASGLSIIPFTAFLLVVIAKSFMLSVLIACVKIANYSGRNPIITRSVFILSPIMTMFTLYLFLKILYYRVSEYRLETFVAVFGTVCVNLLIFVLFDRTLTAERENSVLQLHKNKTELERRTYAELLRMNDRLATVKHDLNNHLLYVKRHMENGDRSALEDYVRNIESMIDSVETPPVTGNGMLDYIISSKLKDEKDIAFVASGDAGIPDGMDELDIALLMGNLLDNAIEAVRRVRKKEKLIEMNFRTFNGYRNITMRNDISTSVLAHNESLTTTKDDKQSHGFGLRSVRNIVGKYNGIIECYEEDGKFCVHLAFPA